MDTLNTTSRVLETLREKIIISHLKPGYKLNEIDISEDLGISRPPLREALRILEKDNMVVNVPRKGTYVSELSLKDFIEVSQTREMIECYCVDLLKASNIRNLPEVESALRKASELPSPFISSDEAESIRHIRVMRDFHVRLVESTGNSLLSRIYSSIGYTLARYQYIYFHIDDAVRQSLDDHAKFLELIREGSFDKAKEELRKHINYTVELVKNRIIHRAVF
ncbi:MAG: GntR family transcriptional regulator [Geobacteraceae bacterium]|nr:GntR family transcriptional regulator [Geobacteraceae bacterium]